MIDTNQLTSLISAFRVETEKESISPETVGAILQQITDLLATASTEAERKVLDNWKAMLSPMVFVYDLEHNTNMRGDLEHMFLTMRGERFGDGTKYNSSVVLYPATDVQAGVMSAAHVQTLMALQRAVSNLRSDLTNLETVTDRHPSQMACVQSAATVVTDIKQGAAHTSKVNLALTKQSVVAGKELAAHTAIAAATDTQAGVMSAAQVQSLAKAKSDITTLKTAVSQLQTAKASTAQQTYFPLAIEINKGTSSLRLRGHEPLVALGYTPYLFRYSRKRNRTKSPDGNKSHGEVRKGWNVVGKAGDVRIGNLGSVFVRDDLFGGEGKEETFSWLPENFVQLKTDERGARYMPFGKVRVYVDVSDPETDELRYRKTRLKYGIAFVRETPEYNRGRVDIAKLATPIVPFYISTVQRNGQFSIIFEK